MYEIISICKGGGYRYCRTNPPHPKANSKGLYPLHRVVMENKLGRSLIGDEEVHHRDENKLNDDPENLEVMTKSDHAKSHSQVLPLVDVVCGHCGTVFHEKPHCLRQRLKRSKNNKLFCSRKCTYEFRRK